MLYEHLVDSPAPALRSLMRWLDEMLEPGQLEFNRFAHQTGLEDPKIAHTSGIHSESVGRWPDAFTPDEARLIWSGTRELWGILDPGNQYGAVAGAVGI